jgi:transcriptional regulator with XRE-family HTH domain
MEIQFVKRVSTLIGKLHLDLRQVVPFLEMDKAQLSKIEKGLRPLKREQISILAEILKVEKYELSTLLVADQIIDFTSIGDFTLKAMQVKN